MNRALVASVVAVAVVVIAAVWLMCGSVHV
jgi:hypothetical protein